MDDFEKALTEQMKDPEFKREYDALRPEYEIVKAIIRGRQEGQITQKQLAKKIGMRQSNISRIEHGQSDPKLSTLKKIAAGLGKELHLEFR